MKKFKSVDELISQLQPDKPVYCIRKKSILSASSFFQKRIDIPTVIDPPKITIVKIY